MTQQPLLTIGIVTYHTPPEMLAQTLASLEACTAAHAVTIVDNSMDNEYFRRLQERVGVRCVQSPANLGYGAGHNLALRHLPRAPYHLVLNPDVRVHGGCLETLLAEMAQSPGVGLIVPCIHNADGTLQMLNKRDPTLLDLALRRFLPRALQALPLFRRRLDYFTMADVGYDEPCDVEFASGCFMLFRREVFDTIGGFDENIFLHLEDADISRRVRRIARLRYCPGAHITHFWARGSHHSLRQTLAVFVSAFYYFRKWGWKVW